MGRIFIKSKSDYKSFIQVETKKRTIKDILFPYPTHSFLRVLRALEYHNNNKGLRHKLLSVFYYRKYCKISLKTGISIPKNTCDKGLTLYHFGSIVVNAACEIGQNCCIMNNVNIGANQGSLKAPKIGNDVYIGPGAVIFGDIEIADGCYIGANAVVNMSITEPNSVIVGMPAKAIKTDPIHWWQKNGLKRMI